MDKDNIDILTEYLRILGATEINIQHLSNYLDSDGCGRTSFCYNGKRFTLFREFCVLNLRGDLGTTQNDLEEVAKYISLAIDRTPSCFYEYRESTSNYGPVINNEIITPIIEWSYLSKNPLLEMAIKIGSDRATDTQYSEWNMWHKNDDGILNNISNVKIYHHSVPIDIQFKRTIDLFNPLLFGEDWPNNYHKRLEECTEENLFLIIMLLKKYYEFLSSGLSSKLLDDKVIDYYECAIEASKRFTSNDRFKDWYNNFYDISTIDGIGQYLLVARVLSEEEKTIHIKRMKIHGRRLKR